MKPTLSRIIFAAILAFIALHFYGQRVIVAEEFALGTENARKVESRDGKEFTASYVKNMASIIEGIVNHSSVSAPDPQYLLWLGNSQLHAINQFRQGDHIAPYWLRESLACSDCIVPLGFSLPNANFQEYLAISQYVQANVPVRAVVMELAYVQMREDALRGDFTPIMTQELQGRIGSTKIGREIISRWEQSGDKKSSQRFSGLEGFIQKRYEEKLNSTLESNWPLWANRSSLYVNFLGDLYNLRNTVFFIKPSTVRKGIKSRSERNMAALEAILADCRRKEIPVIVYIAPVRQDHPIPYDAKEYDDWKKEVAAASARHSALFLNLEQLVPPQYWGSRDGETLDFMHFQGEGHKLVAKALLPKVNELLGKCQCGPKGGI